MHLLNVLSLSITIIHSWNRKTSLFMFAMISEWGRSFNNLFIMLFKRSRMYFFYIFCRLKYCMMTKNWKFSEGKKFNKFLPLYLSQYTQNNYSFLLSANIVKAAFLYLQYLVLQVYKLSLFLDRVLAVLPSMPEALAYSWAVAHLRTLDISQGLGEKSVDLWYLAAKSQT